MNALFSIRLKAVVLLVVLAVGPVVVCLSLLLRTVRDAVRTSEKQHQASVLAEVANTSVRRVRATQSDAESLAAALAEAAVSTRPEDEAMGGVRALLATRGNVAALRFEVPSAKVGTVLKRPSASAVDVPESTAALRERADREGVAFAQGGPAGGILVVPIPFPKRDGKGANGYVTVSVDLGTLETDLGELAALRFGKDGVKLAVLESDGRIVAAVGLSPAERTMRLPVLDALPQGVPWNIRVAVVSEHDEAGIKMVGAVETVAGLGWAVALWRPERVAYHALDEMREEGQRVAVVAVLVALAVGLLAARQVTHPILTLAAQAKLIGQRQWRDIRIPWFGRDEIGTLARSLQGMATDLEKGEQEIEAQAKLRGDLSRYLSKELVTAIVDGKQSLALGGKRMEISVLFADVVAFTPLAEARPAEDVVALLNELFSLLTEIVFRHGGTVDKFIGDCMMVVWGAPIPMDDHAQRALAAAEDIMRFLENANEGWRQKYGVEIRLGVGVNSGEAIVGNIGSDKRMEYTVIGDVVNVAARLEAIAAPNQVLVGAATAAKAQSTLTPAFTLRLLGERKLTGREKATEVFELETG